MLAAVTLVIGAPVAPAGAQTTNVSAAAQSSPTESDTVTVIQVDGTLDPIMADFIFDTIRHADGRVAIQLNSTRGVLSDSTLQRLITTINRENAGVWVGPARAGRALGQAGEL